jgi:hypothetical protein
VHDIVRSIDVYQREFLISIVAIYLRSRWSPLMYSNFRSGKLSSSGVSRLMATLVLVIIGLIVHGTYASKLGLYYDDGETFLQGLHWADGNISRFILSDTFGYLRGERPVAHFLVMIHKAAFTVSLSTLHWSMVLLLILNAVMLQSVAAKIVKENWFIFAVGVIFLTYPLAPLHAICPITLHHLWACLLTLLTILFSWYGLRPTEMRWLKWFAVAAITYTASILTQEVFAFIPLAFVSLFVLSKNQQNTAECYHWGRMSLYKPAIWLMSLFVGVLGIYGLWRILILPMYGTLAYSNSLIVVNPIRVAWHILKDTTKIVFVLWPAVLERITMSPPPLLHISLSIILFVVIWTVTFWLLRRSPASDHTDQGGIAKISSVDPWVQAAIIGMALSIAAVVAIGVSPRTVQVNVSSNFPGASMRVNFVAMVGIALGLPALAVLLVRFCHSSSTLAQDKHRLTSRLIGLGMATMKPIGYASLLSGAVACIALLGTLFHFSIKEQFVAEWRQHKTMLEQLHTLAPSVKDDTFIVIAHDERRSSAAPYSTHWELSSYFLVLYDNWTIMGNTDRQLRFYADGVQSMYFATLGTWFPPGVEGPIVTHAKFHLPHISYDRLLLFEFDGSTLRILPRMEVRTTRGDVLIVQNNPDRILDRMPPRTAARDRF